MKQLHLYLQVIQEIPAPHHELVVRADALHADQRAFNLAGEDVDALDDEHVVGAAHDLLHARMGCGRRRMAHR